MEVTVDDKTTDRVFQRRRVIKGGTIAFNQRRLTYPCVVRDLSASGARLHVDSPDEIPNTFDLLIELDGFESQCETIWREGKQIGVRFLAEPRISAPKRKQVVMSPDRSPTTSIRLARRPDHYDPPPTRPSAADSDSDVDRPRQEPSREIHATPPAAVAPAVPGNPIVIAESDEGGRRMFQEAFQLDSLSPPYEFVGDGRELQQYLAREDRFSDKPRPGMVLLDFDMPHMDGMAALLQIKTTPSLQSIPVVVMTGANDDNAIEKTYGLGVGYYVTKPRTLDDMIGVTKTLTQFWKNFCDTSTSA